MKIQKSFKTGPKNTRDDFYDFEDVQRKSKSKKPKRIRRENFDEENDKLNDYDVYSD